MMPPHPLLQYLDLRQPPFVDKAGSRGHNEKASLVLQPRLAWGFTHSTRARVAELADALASGASDRKVVEVRVLSRAPSKQSIVVGHFASSACWQNPRDTAIYSARSIEAGSIRTARITGRSAANSAPTRITNDGSASICKSVA